MAWLEKLGKKALANLEPYRPGKPISDVQRELGLRQVIRLCSNENPWPLPEAVRLAIHQATSDINRYPDPGAYYLKRALARKWGVSPSEIVTGAGTEGVAFALFQAIIEEGDEVVSPVPSYPLYHIASTAAGARFVCVEAAEDSLAVSLDQIAAAVTERTKAVVLCNPNNPTGTILPRNELLSLASILEGKQILLIVDEAYAEYVTDPRYVSGVDLFRQLGNVVILRTFSKIYGLAGLRIGYGIAPKPIVESYAKVKRVFDVNKVGQEAAVVALEETGFVTETRNRTVAERERLTSELLAMGIKVHSTHTNFLLLKMDDADGVSEALLHDGIIVRSGRDLGLPGYLRVTIGLPEENERFAASLRKAIKRSGKKPNER